MKHFTVKNYFCKTKQLFKDNHEEIVKHNQENLTIALIVATIISFIPIIIALLSPSLRTTIPGYLFTSASSLLLFFIFKNQCFKDYVLLGYYLLYIVLFALSTYLSILKFPTLPAATILTFFSIVPLLVVDRPFRIGLIMLFFYLTHLTLAYIYKGVSLANVDALNTAISLILGLVFARTFVRSQLLLFDGHRLLVIQKETDILTGLYNRRKLHETLREVEDGTRKRPTAIMMLDLDHFKTFNDRFGHRVGDELLNKFGHMLLSYNQHYNICFYRYGGEEFVALIWEQDTQKISQLAEQVRKATGSMNSDEKTITVSVGVSTCQGEQGISPMSWIDEADKAVYLAKDQGRNRVCFYSKDMVSVK